MPTILVAVFFGLHAMVHLLYAGQSLRLFELRPEMSWPDYSWVFLKVLRDETTRQLSAIGLGLAALGFVAGGIALVAHWAAWQPLITGSAAISSLIFVLFWDGKLKGLDTQGGIGVLINLNILVILVGDLVV